MPYIGFRLHDDPGPEKARRGKKKVRKRAVQCVPEWSMRLRLKVSTVEYQVNGWELIPLREGVAGSRMPDKVIAIAPTSGRTLLVFYLCPWPDSARAWPNIQI